MNASSDSPVYAYLKNPSMVDFPGHLAGVFFISGCNFRCGFCHNAALMGRRQQSLSWIGLDSVCRKLRENWADAAVITGGEPTLDERLPDLIRRFRDSGWAVKMDTNGSKPDVLRACLPLLDYVAMDIKAGASKYADLTGWIDLATILESIALIRTQARDYEFRTTIVEPLHDDEQMREIGEMIGGARRYVIQPFVPREGLPRAEFETVPRTSPDALERIGRLMQPCAAQVLIRGG